MTKTIEKEAMVAIKLRAQGLNLTQQKIANELKVSLPTIKRWWAGKGVTLTVVNRLCALLGLSLSQLFLSIEGGSSAYTYTREQELMLVANPKVLALFDLLISGEKVESIQRKYSLKETDMLPMLLKLDRVGLIELHARNKVRLVQSGEPQWIVGGPLSQKYRGRMIEAFLGEHKKSETSFYIHDYLPEDVIVLRGKLKELENLMTTCNARGSARVDEAKSYGAYFSLKEFEWDLRKILTTK